MTRTLLFLAVAWSTGTAHAVQLSGGGGKATDCLLALELGPAAMIDEPKTRNAWECRDGAPCDRDGTCNGSCRLEVRLCANQGGDATCTPPPSLARVRSRGKGRARKIVLPPPKTLVGSACGDAVSFDVPVGTEKKPRPAVLRARAFVEGAKKPRDRDAYRLACLPSLPAACATPVCGDGKVEGDEQCEPGAAACPGADVCDADCRCASPPSPCQCGDAVPFATTFTSEDGSGTCGSVVSEALEPLAVDDDGTIGLACGGLYFGGRGNSVPLPAVVPNHGTTTMKVASCDGTALTLVAASAADAGSPRTCTSAGCLFGAPLPVVNARNPGTSTCVVNTLLRDASGSADCASGRIDVQATLASDIHIGSDSLFDCLVGDTTPPGEACGSDADCGPGGLCPTGIQPCPICVGASGGPTTCHGGPNDGLACTPGTTTPGAAYPTSHDCPPPPAQSIGAIVVPLAQTTEEATLSARRSGTQRLVFCGYCRDADETLAFQEPAVACTSDDECSQPFEACEQNAQGAFAPGGGRASTISLRGSRIGDLRDGQPHPATLVSAFCVPPTFDPLIDAAANLPGPGAVSLPGSSQILR